jgi:antitoxin ChpS
MFDKFTEPLYSLFNFILHPKTMQSEIILRKFGNSTGAVFPPVILRDLGLKAGVTMSMDVSTDGKIVLSPKRKYSLLELIAQCDPKAPIPEDLKIWDTAKPVGQEVW